MQEVITYYLEMKDKNELSSVEVSNGLSVVEAEIDNFKLNRFLYQYVGEPWGWVDKLSLSDEQWREYVETPNLRTWVAYYKGSIAGYFELSMSDKADVEIAYFGLAENFIGKGFGGYLLSQAIQQAWNMENVKRVWVHTCTLDHPSALKNYQARGFKIYKQESSTMSV
ncbi:GNAT family N-acetyltransferase [Agarilytica rhodophyticola]|uniref:GNAT family N-acetyltransferase n=1 Tax=Agarilytica rhodophyticola TaxID=1737490 RepID=UPI001FE3D6C4|nr:GNAT family N-acetyltransferase [Agarilytica rhodophyticola]